MNPSTLPRAYDNSTRHCPRCHKRMALDVGQDENRGELVVRHWCLSCPYFEDGPRNPTVAAKSPTLAAIRDRIRADGWVVPMRLDLPAVEEVDADA